MKRIFFFISTFAVAMAGYAQSSSDGYFIGKNFISYNDSLMSEADVPSFTIMGHGYAKDNRHVYLNGKVLEYADYATFSLTDRMCSEGTKTEDATKNARPAATEKEKTRDNGKTSVLDIVLGTDNGTNKYAVNGTVVAYEGKVIKKADAASFKYVGGEYAADKHHAYYKGNILSDAWGIGQFTYKGNGYATDGVHWYCNGKPVDRD